MPSLVGPRHTIGFRICESGKGHLLEGQCNDVGLLYWLERQGGAQTYISVLCRTVTVGKRWHRNPHFMHYYKILLIISHRVLIDTVALTLVLYVCWHGLGARALNSFNN